PPGPPRTPRRSAPDRLPRRHPAADAATPLPTAARGPSLPPPRAATAGPWGPGWDGSRRAPPLGLSLALTAQGGQLLRRRDHSRPIPTDPEDDVDQSAAEPQPRPPVPLLLRERGHL